MVQWLSVLAYRHVAGLARLVASLLGASVILLMITDGLLHDAETSALSGPSDSAIVILAMARATNNTGRVLIWSGLLLCIVVGTVILLSRSRLATRTNALSYVTEGVSTFASNLDALVSQLAELESNYVRTNEALAKTVRERETQDKLISLTRSQAEAIRGEIRTAASTGSKFQIVLAELGILLAIGLAVIAS